MINSGNLIIKIREMLKVHNSKKTILQDTSEKNLMQPFKILIATVLSQRTKDANTKKAVDSLFSEFKGPKEIAEADENKIQNLIKTAGFYRVKANSIKKISEIMITKYNGEVPRNFKDLLSLPLVGRKTANCVLVYGFGIPAIPVDTHVHRISNRIGLVKTRNPEETESELLKIIDQKYWIEFNELFVRFGQKICKPVKPQCSLCKLNDECEWYRNHFEANTKNIPIK